MLSLNLMMRYSRNRINKILRYVTLRRLVGRGGILIRVASPQMVQVNSKMKL